MPLTSMLAQMLDGTVLTVVIFIVTIIVSMPLGLCITYMYTGKNRLLSRITGFYVFIMRGTPLLLQMFFIFYGLPYVPVIGQYMIVGRLPACLIAFTLNYAAYFAEIFRGGLLSVDKGQYDAAKVLGISPFMTQIRIVIPQMIKVVLPAIGNEAIILVKDTALVTVLGQMELLNVTKKIVNATASVMPFAVAAVFYLIMSWFVTAAFGALEKKFMFE